MQRKSISPQNQICRFMQKLSMPLDFSKFSIDQENDAYDNSWMRLQEKIPSTPH